MLGLRADSRLHVTRPNDRSASRVSVALKKSGDVAEAGAKRHGFLTRPGPGSRNKRWATRDETR